MTNLVAMTNGEATVTSRQVAENFGKELGKVHRSIEGIKESIDVATFGKMFHEVTLADSYGRPQKAFIINRDGFTLLAIQWKLKYIEKYAPYRNSIRIERGHADYGMVAYHFTSLENFQQIRNEADTIYRRNEERAVSNSCDDYTDGSEYMD